MWSVNKEWIFMKHTVHAKLQLTVVMYFKTFHCKKRMLLLSITRCWWRFIKCHYFLSDCMAWTPMHWLISSQKSMYFLHDEWSISIFLPATAKGVTENQTTREKTAARISAKEDGKFWVFQVIIHVLMFCVKEGSVIPVHRFRKSDVMSCIWC